MSIRFAHMSDCHLGSWSSHPDMKEMPLRAFETAVDKCIVEGVDFIIIAGDLLDTSLPSVDVLRRAAAKFRECKEKGVQVYLVAGSHDYSPTGKTMLSVFEEAGLIKNVADYEEDKDKIRLKFTVDEKTGAKITGLFGRKGSLEVAMFDKLDRGIENEPGFKIFVFHCGIDEHISMAGMNAVPASLLPGNFDYYASGHIHIKNVYNADNKIIAFPGPLFPTSFDELENYESGFYIVNYDGKLNMEQRTIKLLDTLLIEIDANEKTPGAVEEEILGTIESAQLENTVVLLKIRGTLKSGSPTDIDFKLISSKAESSGALSVKRNTSRLSSRELEETVVENVTNIDELEKRIIAEHADKMKLGKNNMQQLLLALMNVMKEEKGDETNVVFEERIKENAKRLLEL